jgi:hypothetical protein
MTAKGYKGKYFTVAAIQATTVQRKVQEQVSCVKNFLVKTFFTKDEDDELEEDPPQEELATFNLQPTASRSNSPPLV